MGVIDTYGIEPLHPMRKAAVPARSAASTSNHRWIVGGKSVLPINGVDRGVCDTAHVADNTFQGLIRQCEEQMIV
jgi:hypothetical protein